jgi:NDP-sugar pyrophosphorylase family protein
MFRAPVFERRPAGEAFDMADVMRQLVAQNELAGFEVSERFYEIGSPAGLAELEELLAKGPVRQK